MTSLLSLSNVNMDIIMKKCETCRIKYKNCAYILKNVEDSLIEYKFLCCKKLSKMFVLSKFDKNFFIKTLNELHNKVKIYLKECKLKKLKNL